MADPMDVDDFQTSSDVFLTWLRNKGSTISSKIQLADLRDRAAGRGVVALEDLNEDEGLFSIPRSSILTVETSDLPTDLKTEIDDPWLSLILTMVFEYLRGSESTWEPYFAILPDQFDTLMFWTDDELQHLEGSAVIDKIGKESADATFSEQLIPSIAKHSNLFNTAHRSNNDLLALCHRMGSTIMAYAFDLEKPSTETSPSNEEEWEEDSEEEHNQTLPKGMIPLADMLNADATRNNAKLFYENDKVVMKTIQPVRAGEELFNDFGPLPRADLLRRYGYVTNNYAKYDVVEISSDLIKARAKSQRKLSENDLYPKWQYAEEQGILDDAYDIGHAGSEEGQFPEELGVLLNLVVLSDAEFEKMAKKDKLPKAELTAEAKELLRSVLVHRYAMYPLESGTQEQLSGRAAMAKQVVQGEKKVLEDAFEAVTDSAGRKRTANTLEEEAVTLRQPAKK